MFFERAEGGEKALLVHIDFMHLQEQEDLDEFIDLSLSADLSIVKIVKASRSLPHPKTYLGSGKLEEIQAEVEAGEVDVVLFNHTLSPSQERNLETILKCKVIDRTELILDIFAQRARTHEGKLQVELAQLQYMSTRLVRGWTHLERQKGGIGLRGPGETQLETDRRLLRVRIKSIQRRLEKVQKQREQGRRSRKKKEIPMISIVGYTNAGKSTLFNAITQSEVYAADQLFATLDPTVRRIPLADVGPAVLADTVGFIKHLPHKLVDAFKATLEETVAADLLVHVVDGAAPERDDNQEQVNDVLEDIGAGEQPQLLVFNKIDLLGQVEPKIDYNADGRPVRVWLSAKTGQGLELLNQALSECLAGKLWQAKIKIGHDMQALRAQLFALDAVTDEQFDELGHAVLCLRIAVADKARLEKQFNQNLDALCIEN